MSLNSKKREASEISLFDQLCDAVIDDDTELTTALLSKNPSLVLQKDEDGNTVLMFTESAEVCDIILQHASNLHSLESLLKCKDSDGRTAFELAAGLGKIDVLQSLMDVDYFEYCTDLRMLLHFARQASLDFPDSYYEYDDICVTLREMLEEQNNKYHSKKFRFSHRAKIETAKQQTPTFSQSYQFLYKKLLSDESPQHTKESAIRHANSAFYCLLNNTAKCNKLLVFLNNEFARYYHETHHREFPAPDKKQYDFKLLHNTYFPIPHADYRHIKKDSALQEFLLSLFRKHGIGRHAYQWIGFVPNELADKNIADGDFASESVYGTALLHGKLSHMLQTALLIYAIDSRLINTTYRDETGKLSALSVQELLESQVTKNDLREQHTSIWSTLRDVRVIETITYSDAHRLSSVIMHDGERLGMPALSHSLIDTFCNGFIKMHAACKVIISGLPGLDQFAEQLADTQPHLFTIPNYLVAQAKAKQSGFFSPSTANYAVIEKDYRPNPEFTPREYAPPSLQP